MSSKRDSLKTDALLKTYPKQDMVSDWSYARVLMVAEVELALTRISSHAPHVVRNDWEPRLIVSCAEVLLGDRKSNCVCNCTGKRTLSV